MNHPLRADASRKHLAAALELLEEIRRTGDIFFPTRWTANTLAGHRSREAAAIVRGFLDEHPTYPQPLRRVVLQQADDLFRAAERQM